MRLVDADKLKNILQNLSYDDWNQDITAEAYLETVDAIENAPTVDAEPIRHGVWIGKPIGGYSTVRCSVCGHVFFENNGKWKYCPNCGAKMDEENKMEYYYEKPKAIIIKDEKPHAHWEALYAHEEPTSNVYRCSNCGKGFADYFDDDYDYYNEYPVFFDYDRCPHCGAIMDGDTEFPPYRPDDKYKEYWRSQKSFAVDNKVAKG